MSTYTDTAEKVQGQVLDGIKQLQATNLEMVANFSKTVGAIVPKTPELPVGYDPQQLIERSFNFTTNILELQKDYLIRLTGTLKPLAKTASANGAAVNATTTATANGAPAKARKPATANRAAARARASKKA